MTEKTEAPKRKAPAAKPPVRKDPEPRVEIAVGDTVTYRGDTAVVTGTDKKTGTLYLDTPVCCWVAAAECSKE